MNVTNVSNIPSVKTVTNTPSVKTVTNVKNVTNIQPVPDPMSGRKRPREEEDERSSIKKVKKIFMEDGMNQYGNTMRYLADHNIRIDIPDDPFFDVVDHAPLGIVYLDRKRTYKLQNSHTYQTVNVDISGKEWESIRSREYRVHVRCFEVSERHNSPYIPDHTWPDEILLRINGDHATIDKYDKKRCTIDLPCDVSPWVRQGPNEFSTAFNTEKENASKNYCIVIQLVKVTSSGELIERLSSDITMTTEESLKRDLEERTLIY
jgi:hypothetical protein